MLDKKSLMILQEDLKSIKAVDEDFRQPLTEIIKWVNTEKFNQQLQDDLVCQIVNDPEDYNLFCGIIMVLHANGALSITIGNTENCYIDVETSFETEKQFKQFGKVVADCLNDHFQKSGWGAIGIGHGFDKEAVRKSQRTYDTDTVPYFAVTNIPGVSDNFEFYLHIDFTLELLGSYRNC
jgi:hypothetical protein